MVKVSLQDMFPNSLGGATMSKSKTKDCHPVNFSGRQVIRISSSGRETAQVPYPITLESVDQGETHLISFNRSGAKELIQALLEFI